MQQRCITIWLCFVINPIEYLLVMSECFKGEANTNTHPQELKNYETEKLECKCKQSKSLG